MQTWDEAAQRWLLETSHKRSSTWDRHILEWLRPYLTGLLLTQINRSVLDHVTAQRAIGVKPGTVNRYMSLVRAILRRACYDWEWIERVPKVRMLIDRSARIRSLSPDEWAQLLSELPPHLADMAIFSVATGLRQANVKNLCWHQISLERKHLWIAATDHKNGIALSVPLNATALEVLNRLQGQHPTHVFTYQGHPVKNVATKAWRKALKRSGIEDFRWHDLRHTFATWHRFSGTPTWELQRLGGWKTASMVDRYAHLSPDSLLPAAARLDAMFSKK